MKSQEITKDTKLESGYKWGLQSMWSKKPKKKKEHEFTTDAIKFNQEGVVHKKHPFTEREFDGAFKECGCLPDCGCKE